MAMAIDTMVFMNMIVAMAANMGARPADRLSAG